MIGIGNPSRGDDALGPLLVERLEALSLQDTELLTDFQLQIEYVLDLAGREEVVFVDAAVSGAAPFDFKALEPEADASFTTHALAPAALLAACTRLAGPAPKAYLLAIRGYEFELGAELSAGARRNLEAAVVFLRKRLG